MMIKTKIQAETRKDVGANKILCVDSIFGAVSDIVKKASDLPSRSVL